MSSSFTLAMKRVIDIFTYSYSVNEQSVIYYYSKRSIELPGRWNDVNKVF